MDALPSELGHWRANALYILGDKAVLQDIPDDLYPNCMFVPVEVRVGWNHTSGGWIRGSSLHTEVATLQGVGLEGVHRTQRWPHFRGLD